MSRPHFRRRLGALLLGLGLAMPATVGLPGDETALDGDLSALARRHAATLSFSTLFTAQNVRDYLSSEEGIETAVAWCRRTAITRVYLEAFRDGYTAERDVLERARRRFESEGILASGCITTTGLGRKSVKGWVFPCFSDERSLQNLQRAAEFAAGIFDEIMVDDFFATACECEDCSRERGDRSWSAFRCDLMVKVSRERLLEPARRVNPDVRVIIKFPQWYEDFHNRGYDVLRQPAMFDRIWVGTETRDPASRRWGRKSQYEAYFIMRWLGGLGGEKCGGGWFDPYGTSPATYLEQARQTVLGGAREALLFCYGALQKDTGPENVTALRREIPLLFELADLLRGRQPRGLAAPRPPSADAGGDRYVYDFVGLLGIPLVPGTRLDPDASAAFLSAHDLSARDVEDAVTGLIEKGTPLLVTRNFLEGWKGKRMLLEDHARVLDLPDDRWELMRMPAAEIAGLRRPLLEPLGVQLEAPARVALYLFGDDLAVVENFADRAAAVLLRLEAGAQPDLLMTLPRREVDVARTSGEARFELAPRSLAVLRFAKPPRSGARDADEKPLVPLDSLRPDQVLSRDAVARPARRDGEPALRIRTGTKLEWPGITVRAPGGSWDLSSRSYISVDLRNCGRHRATVHFRVDNPGADGRKHCVTESVTLDPGGSGAITVPLSPRRLEEGSVEFIGMRGDPPVSPPLDPSRVTQFLLFVSRPEHEHDIEVTRVVAGGGRTGDGEPVRAADFFPMIDELGQYTHADWPGKTHSLEELRAQSEAEEAELRAQPGPRERDRYGGWTAGPRLEATGFFRIEKLGRTWWFVDPQGRLFWSHGLDCVHARAATPITDRERYFRALPEASSPCARFYGRGRWAPHGYYRDHAPYRTFDFFGANLLRTHGEDWATVFADLTQRRMRSWGLNTIANWSDREIYELRRTPYVATLGTGGRELEGSSGYWGKFRDVFDPSFRESLRRRLASEKGRSIGDPWCIGFFVDNELGWGDEVSLAVAALQSPPEQAAKREFIADLRKKYRDIEKLNAAWGTEHESWEALLAAREPPSTDRARDDLTAFYTRTAETYFRSIREELRAAAPHQLYLGCRFAWVNDRAARAAAKYCDVISYNRYAYSVVDHRPPEGVDRPTIIGEFHFGALDRGMFHTGLRKARDQEHRAELYREYVLGALRNPSIVGTHWFQYKDQATTGRGDGENYQIGFVDVCDRPYPEIVRAAREVGRQMYALRWFEGR